MFGVSNAATLSIYGAIFYKIRLTNYTVLLIAKAAYFGLSLLVNGNLSPILPAKKALNVINHVRGKSIGVPITYNQ